MNNLINVDMHFLKSFYHIFIDFSMENNENNALQLSFYYDASLKICFGTKIVYQQTKINSHFPLETNDPSIDYRDLAINVLGHGEWSIEWNDLYPVYYKIDTCEKNEYDNPFNIGNIKLIAEKKKGRYYLQASRIEDNKLILRNQMNNNLKWTIGRDNEIKKSDCIVLPDKFTSSIHATIEFTPGGAIITENNEKKSMNGVWFAVKPNKVFNTAKVIKIGNKTFVDVTILQSEQMELSFGVPQSKKNQTSYNVLEKEDIPIYKDIIGTPPFRENEKIEEHLGNAVTILQEKLDETTTSLSNTDCFQHDTKIQGGKMIETPATKIIETPVTTIINAISNKSHDTPNILSEEDSKVAGDLHYPTHEAIHVISTYKNDEGMKIKIKGMLEEYGELKDYSENSLLLIGYKYIYSTEDFTQFIIPIIH